MTHSPIAIAVMRINKINAMIPEIRATARVLVFGILSGDGIMSDVVEVFTGSIVMGVLLSGTELTDVVEILFSSTAELIDVVGEGTMSEEVISVLLSGT